jgi:hypothetical protein
VHLNYVGGAEEAGGAGGAEGAEEAGEEVANLSADYLTSTAVARQLSHRRTAAVDRVPSCRYAI